MPLAARTHRYWPWAYGQQSKDVGLHVTASTEGVAALKAERLERARLLYVGITGTRDHLALAVTGQTESARSGSVTRSSRPASDGSLRARIQPPRPVFAAATHPPLPFRSSKAVVDGTVGIAERARLGDQIALTGYPALPALEPVGRRHTDQIEVRSGWRHCSNCGTAGGSCHFKSNVKALWTEPTANEKHVF